MADINPFRYRTYYYDNETWFYYLQSRYYDSAIGRFINADDTAYLGADGSLISYNLFAYCGNNPVIGYDPTGHWNWRNILDVVVTTVAAIAGVCSAIKTTVKASLTGASKTSATIKGAGAGVATFGTVNNAANAIYYNYFSDGESDLETTYVDLPYEEMKSDYVNGYVNRWDRLDYTKHVTQSDTYDMNAWRFHSEYSLHMHLWNIVEPFQGKGIWIADRIGKSTIHAHIDPYSHDPDWKIQALTTVVGILGI